MSLVKNEDFKIIKGKDSIKLYQFHTKVAKHFFAQVVVSIPIIIQDPIQQ